jgi:hypothetical protein
MKVLGVIGALPALWLSAAGRVPASAGSADQAHALVSRVLANMSAGTDVARLATLEFEGHETLKDLVENDHPLTSPFYNYTAYDVRRGWDYDRRRQRSDTLKTGAVVATRLTADGASVSLSSGSGTTERSVTAATPSWETRDPVGALRLAANAKDLTLAPDIVLHGVIQHVVIFHDGLYPVRILIDASTMLPTATEATVALDDQNLPDSIAWNALGDIVEHTEYMNWSFVGGIRYPLEQDELRNGDLLRSLKIDSVKVGTPIDTAAAALKPGEGFAPASIQDFRPSSRVPGPYPDKPIAEIAPGIVQIPNSWYATIVRQRDGLVVIDAPISAGYSKGVLDEAARRFPGVPIKALITSTGFFWHVAGVREYAARGIPIYADARNVSVIRRFLSSPHRLVPDALERARVRMPRVIAVDDRLVIGTGTNAIAVYPVSKATQPMLMTYIADARLLHTGEMVQPLGPGGSILYPESLIELTDTVRARGLRVDRIIGMHMSPTPWSAVADTLRQAGVVRTANAAS